MTVKVLLADDHILVRQGMRALLESRGNITVVAEASDGLEAVQLVEKLKPDVTVLDLMMPGLNGLEVTRQIAKITNILIVSMHANEAYVLEALWNGAYGYVLKDSTAEELIDAVMTVAAGHKYLSAPLSERAIPEREAEDALVTRLRQEGVESVRSELIQQIQQATGQQRKKLEEFYRYVYNNRSRGKS